MKTKLLFFIILFVQQSFSQNRLQGIILDQETKSPIEYADIYNSQDFTSSNEEGKFLFVSKNDSLKIGILGYNPIYSTFQEQKKDTILLNKKIQNLDEVVVNADGNLLTSILKNLEKNYPLRPYKERFFLRSILRRNDHIIQLADFSGKVERQTLFSTKSNPMPKKNYSIEVENLRKAGIKEKDIDFTLSSFEELFNIFIAVYMSPEIHEFKYVPFEDSSMARLEFTPKKGNEFASAGYYLVNLKDKAFSEVRISNIQNSKFTSRKNFKYRTTNYEVVITFKKNHEFNKYAIDKASMNAVVEVIPEKEETIIYTVDYKLHTYENFRNLGIKNNISLSKDIFNLKKDFNQDFWETQHYLLLTKEMEDFLELLGGENNDFKSVTNINSQ